MCIDLCVIPFCVLEKYLLHIPIMCILVLFIFTKRFIENEFISSNVALHLTKTLWVIKINFHCRLIITVFHVYIVIAYVLYDDNVCMYKSLQIKFIFCSVHTSDVFAKTRGRATGLKKRNLNNMSKWLNRDCYVARKEYNKSRNSFIRNKSTQNKLFGEKNEFIIE